jgi:hypothetical protein
MDSTKKGAYRKALRKKTTLVLALKLALNTPALTREIRGTEKTKRIATTNSIRTTRARENLGLPRRRTSLFALNAKSQGTTPLAALTKRSLAKGQKFNRFRRTILVNLALNLALELALALDLKRQKRR